MVSNDVAIIVYASSNLYRLFYSIWGVEYSVLLCGLLKTVVIYC